MLCRDIPLRCKTAARGAYRDQKLRPQKMVWPPPIHLPQSACVPQATSARGLRVVPLTGHNLVNDTFQLGLFLLLLPTVLGVWAGTQGKSRVVGESCPASMDS